MSRHHISPLSAHALLLKAMPPYSENDGAYFHLSTIRTTLPHRRWDLDVLSENIYRGTNMPEEKLQARRIGHKTVVLRDSFYKFIQQLYEINNHKFTFKPDDAMAMLCKAEVAYRLEVMERASLNPKGGRRGSGKRTRIVQEKKAYDTATLANVWCTSN